MNPTMEFHISRQARNRYQFDEGLFSQNGNVIFTNFLGSRQFAQRMNSQRDLVANPENAVSAGQINAMGLIDEMLHRLIESYRQERNPAVMAQAIAWLEAQFSPAQVDNLLRQFCDEFPPLAVYRSEISIEAYLAGSTNGLSNREILLEEVLLLWMANANPGFAPYQELFSDANLQRNTIYNQAITSLYDFFATQPTFGSEAQNLIDVLRAPALASPLDLSGQLNFLTRKYGVLLGSFIFRLLSSIDFIKEEEKLSFGTGGGAGVPVEVIHFAGQEAEPEAFSPDRDWMPNLVLIAKNIYVWLDQLSKKYKRSLTRLDQIPDAELDMLARGGITGLWLIGLWERSIASRTIKQMRGNPDAVASAYSLMDYHIAQDLGGEEALKVLRENCQRRGIRLASDMVPNHMGIDSNWVIEHPDWFISLDQPPFPSYSFNGPNLSWDNRVGLFIEDHYFNNSDAAVVFKRQDFWTGDVRFIYHGNDGTSMPWNDTAQLNYLLPQVREAVIQTILDVARRTPIIRFDAAMTLAKRHFQRLWFPEPGSGGDIPSRAGLGLTKEQFDSLIPVEFWREVVDRVAQEVPDTLLLAEAFWLMEGYFVRTLGMHRVYNSAFMNMMRDEKNLEYRNVIKNTLEFDPEILKRYVNFMNNPDEKTAVEQFGKGDKYFGVCIMMATLPGLPMIGHGQIEGYTEKYGMEYRRAYWEEIPDSYLIERHDREIFPVLRKRYLFSEAYNFLLYDLYTPEGGVNEDVFAYSNHAGNERSLVLYHNRFASARGWIRRSAAYAVKDADGNRTLQQKNLAEGLDLENNPDLFTIFTDQISGLEYIVNNQDLHEKGLFIELDAYKYRVLVDFRQVLDDENHRYAQLVSFLNGRGVPNVAESAREIYLQPILTPFKELVNPGFFRWLVNNRLTPDAKEASSFDAALEEADSKFTRLLVEAKQFSQGTNEIEPIAAGIHEKLAALLRLTAFGQAASENHNEEFKAALQFAGLTKLATTKKKTGATRANDEPPGKQFSLQEADFALWGIALSWLFTHSLGGLVSDGDAPSLSRTWMDEWLLAKHCTAALVEGGLEQGSAERRIALTRLLINHQNWWQVILPETAPLMDLNDESENYTQSHAYALLTQWFSDPDIQNYLKVNRYQGIVWYNKESFEEFLWWLNTIALICLTSRYEANDHSPALEAEITAIFDIISKIQKADSQANYQVERLLNGVQ